MRSLRISTRASGRPSSPQVDSVIACGFGHEQADATAREILAEAYPGRRVVTVNALEIFARGGGIHCITQQQPEVKA